MSGDLTVAQWVERLKAVAGKQLRAHIETALIEFALSAEGYAKDNATVSPKVRSGRLYGSIEGKGGVMDGRLRAELSAGGRTGGGDVTYARIQEMGGTIRPKKGKYLAIPMPAAQTGSGVTRKGPRDYGDLRFQPGRDGSYAWLVRDAGRGKTARSELMFKLVRKVEIRPKKYLQRGFDQAKGELPGLLSDAFTAATGG